MKEFSIVNDGNPFGHSPLLGDRWAAVHDFALNDLGCSTDQFYTAPYPHYRLEVSQRNKAIASHRVDILAVVSREFRHLKRDVLEAFEEDPTLANPPQWILDRRASMGVLR